MKTDCIFFVDKHKDLPQFHECKYSHSLFKRGTEDESMCQLCRLWDAYIPQNASDLQKERAITWQNMPLDKQPDYHDYF